MTIMITNYYNLLLLLMIINYYCLFMITIAYY